MANSDPDLISVRYRLSRTISFAQCKPTERDLAKRDLARPQSFSTRRFVAIQELEDRIHLWRIR
jgi:hypothetical protein